MKKQLSAVLVVIALLSGRAPQASGQGFALVVNEKNPTASLSKAAASQLFLRQTRTWAHGGSVTAVDQDRSAPAREAFSTAVHGKSVANIEAFWLQSVFAGKEEPPAKVKDDAAVMAFVAGNAGAIGYVSAGATVAAGVKKVAIKP